MIFIFKSCRFVTPTQILPPRKDANTVCPVRRTARIRWQRWVFGEHTCARLQIPSIWIARTETETHGGRKYHETSCNTERTDVEEEGRGRGRWRQTEDHQDRIKSCDLADCSAIKTARHEHNKTRTHNQYRIQRNCPKCGSCKSHQTSTCPEPDHETCTWPERSERIYACSRTCA